MKLGTVSYDGNIYNLDYMNTMEIDKLLNKIEIQKQKEFLQGKMITERKRD